MIEASDRLGFGQDKRLVLVPSQNGLLDVVDVDSSYTRTASFHLLATVLNWKNTGPIDDSPHEQE